MARDAEVGVPPLSPEHLGKLVGRALEGAWRAQPPPLTLTADQLARITPILTSSGTAALGWWRARRYPELAADSLATPLHDAARLHAVRDAIRESALAEITAVLNDAGIVPLVFKGWAAARHYAESYLRPYGDFDLLVRPEDDAAARQILAQHSRVQPVDITLGQFAFETHTPQGPHSIDLQTLPAWYRAPVDTLFARAVPVTLTGGWSLLVPGPEDHLRLVCLHLFKHGAWRPLWLCDVAAMVESAGPDFDWDRCLTASAVTAGWIKVAVASAHALLGCRVDHLPVAVRLDAPNWLVDAVLAEWDAIAPPRPVLTGRESLRHPIAKTLSLWPGPILASFGCGAGPSGRARFLHRLAYFGYDFTRRFANLFDREWWLRTQTG